MATKKDQPRDETFDTNQSITTSVLEIQNKLKEVVSPSSSKPDEYDEYYMQTD